jgi:hypothetical protein
MQVIDAKDVIVHTANGRPIPLGTEDVKVNLKLWQCLGGICGELRDYIRQNMEMIKNLDNRSDKASLQLSSLLACFDPMKITCGGILKLYFCSRL